MDDAGNSFLLADSLRCAIAHLGFFHHGSIYFYYGCVHKDAICAI